MATSAHLAPRRNALDARDYGAVGDGSMNDTDAIQRTLDAAAQTGSEAFLPPGTYLVSAPGVTLAAGVTLRGAGESSIVFVANGTGTQAITLGSGSTVCDLKVDGNKANQSTGAGGAAINALADNCRVERCTVVNAFYYGIRGVNADGIKLIGNRIIDSAHIGIFVEANALAVTDVLDPVISENYVDRSALGAGVVEGGIKIHGNNTQRVMRALVERNTVLMPASPSSAAALCIEVWHGCPHAVIAGNTTSGGSMGISVDTSDYSTVTGNTLTGMSLYGIEVPLSTGVTVAGNTIQGLGAGTSRGIITNNVPGATVTITGNTVSECLRGISIQGSERAVVSGNTVRRANGVVTDYGINIASTSRNTVTGNLVSGDFAKSLVFDTCTDVTAVGNSLTGYSQHGIMVYAATAITISVCVIGNRFAGSAGVGYGTLLSGGATVATGAKVLANLGQADPSVTGSRGGNAALESLLVQLASLGLIANNTTA